MAMFELLRYIPPEGGASCYQRWLDEVRDPLPRSRIMARVNRIAGGNFGDCKPVGGGVWELRIDAGPGYRVYYTRLGRQIVLLLGGGSKQGQQADIAMAITRRTEYLGRARNDQP